MDGLSDYTSYQARIQENSFRGFNSKIFLRLEGALTLPVRHFRQSCSLINGGLTCVDTHNDWSWCQSIPGHPLFLFEHRVRQPIHVRKAGIQVQRSFQLYILVSGQEHGSCGRAPRATPPL